MFLGVNFLFVSNAQNSGRLGAPCFIWRTPVFANSQTQSGISGVRPGTDLAGGSSNGRSAAHRSIQSSEIPSIYEELGVQIQTWERGLAGSGIRSNKWIAVSNLSILFSCRIAIDMALSLLYCRAFCRPLQIQMHLWETLVKAILFSINQFDLEIINEEVQYLAKQLWITSRHFTSQYV